MEKDNVFVFDCNCPILLYGENEFAHATYSNLLKAGYNVKGFIDQKYKSIEDSAVCIRMSMEHIGAIDNIEKYIIIICLRNGMQHDYVAQMLCKCGVRKIIYCPMRIKNSLYVRHRYRLVYQLIRSFAYEKIESVPIYMDEENRMVIINRSTDTVSFWCPIRYLHTMTKTMIEKTTPKGLESGKPYKMQYADVCIKDIKLYSELFSWLSGRENADVDSYLIAMGRTSDIDKQKLLNDRKELFLVYEEVFKYDMQFFADSPAEGRWNRKGYFNIVDGMHRTWYLYSKGLREVPIIVSIEDFNIFSESIKMN